MNSTKSFAPVVPLSIARFLRDQGALGNYHLLLAHDVLANPGEYQSIYCAEPMDIIMDNSLIELGYPMRIRDVIEAAHVVKAKRIVLPDVLGDLKATLDLVYEGVETFRMLPLDVTRQMTMVGVVQGDTLSECKKCLHEYGQMGMEISIPRVLVEKLGTRSEVIAWAANMGFNNIHLLGFSDNLIDDVACARMPGVKGIDSAVPIRAGIKRVEITLDDADFSQCVGPRGDYWDTRVEHLPIAKRTDIIHNIRTFRRWINVNTGA